MRLQSAAVFGTDISLRPAMSLVCRVDTPHQHTQIHLRNDGDGDGDGDVDGDRNN